jgi:hypothetical protein
MDLQSVGAGATDQVNPLAVNFHNHNRYLGVIQKTFKFSRDRISHCDVVKPLAWISPSKVIPILPSGRTTAFVVRSGVRHTRISRTSSDPIMKSFVAVELVLDFAAGFALVWANANDEAKKRIKKIPRIPVLGEFHKSSGDGSLIEAATVLLPPV